MAEGDLVDKGDGRMNICSELDIIIVMQKSKKVGGYLIDFKRALGHGSFGSVFICVEEQTGREYAMKIIGKEACTTEYLRNALKSELAIHKSLQHINIVRFVDVIVTANNYYIVQEYCEKGNLRELMNRCGKLSEGDALHCLKCICAGFEALMEKSVIHRDLKPQNIIISENQLKLTDFGFAKKLFSQQHMTRTAIGTPLYMAPQLLMRAPYSSKCDVWSLGVIYFELLFGQHPWTTTRFVNLPTMIKSKGLVFPTDTTVSEQSIDFITKCLQFEEVDRLAWIQVYEHRLMGADFNQKAKEWRSQYIQVSHRLNQLSRRVTAEQLIGGFLQLKVASLSFDDFKCIMKWLLGQCSEKEMATMYELFDKDKNGVIDLEEFVGSFHICPLEPVSVLHTLISKGHCHEDMQTREMFTKLCSQYGIEGEEEIRKAYEIVSSIELEK